MEILENAITGIVSDNNTAVVYQAIPVCVTFRQGEGHKRPTLIGFVFTIMTTSVIKSNIRTA